MVLWCVLWFVVLCVLSFVWFVVLWFCGVVMAPEDISGKSLNDL